MARKHNTQSTIVKPETVETENTEVSETEGTEEVTTFDYGNIASAKALKERLEAVKWVHFQILFNPVMMQRLAISGACREVSAGLAKVKSDTPEYAKGVAQYFQLWEEGYLTPGAKRKAEKANTSIVKSKYTQEEILNELAVLKVANDVTLKLAAYSTEKWALWVQKMSENPQSIVVQALANLDKRASDVEAAKLETMAADFVTI